MSNGPRRPRRPAARLPRDEVNQLARTWAWELVAAGVYQRTRAELELALRRPVAQLLEALHSDPFIPRAGRQVGADLVALHAVQPDALRRTFLLLAGGIPGDLALPEPARRSRLHLLLAELVTGWVEAAQAEILTAQDSLRVAVDTARATDPARNPWFDDPDQ